MKKRTNKKPVIAGKGKMIYILEPGFDMFHIFRNIDKINNKAVTLVQFDLSDVFGLKPCIQYYDPVSIVFGSIGDQRCHSNI